MTPPVTMAKMAVLLIGAPSHRRFYAARHDIGAGNCNKIRTSPRKVLIASSLLLADGPIPSSLDAKHTDSLKAAGIYYDKTPPRMQLRSRGEGLWL